MVQTFTTGITPSAARLRFCLGTTVIWAYCAFGLVLATGLVTIFARGDWQKARGFDKLILLRPLFSAAPVAAFGTEHFTATAAIKSIIPAWIPWRSCGLRAGV